MRTILPYGRGSIRLMGLPEGVIYVLPPVFAVQPIAPEQVEQVLEEKLEHPIGGARLSERLAGAQNVTIVAPDKTRKAGQRQYIPALIEFMETRGMLREHVRVLLGLGTHPGHTEAEQDALLTPALAAELRGRDALAESAGSNAADFVALGSTKRGTPVKLHRWLTEETLILVTGSITYHYYAGYSGGRKGVLPGCAASDSIRASHQLAFTTTDSGVIRTPNALPGVLRGNPIVEDQIEAVGMLPSAPFLVNTITDPRDQIIEIVAGDLLQAHAYGCTLVDGYYQAPLEQTYDLVIASAGGYPSDINLIQSHKALDNAVRACTPGGTVVLLAECSQGLGNPRAIDWALGSADAVLRRLSEDFQIVGGTVEGVLRKCEGWDVRLVSTLPEATTQKFGFGCCATLVGETLEVADLLPDSGRIALMPAAGITMPAPLPPDQ